jgi:hypothetical protein
MEAEVVHLDIIDEWLKSGAKPGFWFDDDDEHPEQGDALVDSISVASPDPQPPETGAVTRRLPEHEIARFGEKGEYRLVMAVAEADRLACWRLVYQEYVALGYVRPSALEYRYTLHDALPDTAAFLVERSGEAVGTVSVIPDSPLGLPADESHPDALAQLRAAGRSPVEVGRLAIRKDCMNDRTVLVALFDALSIYGRCVRRATDLVITVNPGHARYYERMLLFECLGEERALGSVCGAPAVLLRLDLDVERRMRRYTHGEGPKPEEYSGGRTFFPLVPGEVEERIRAGRMVRARAKLSESFLRRYFVKVRPLIPNLPAALRYFFEKCYPGCRLVDLPPRDPWPSPACVVARATARN